jgi:hypothetical protein
MVQKMLVKLLVKSRNKMTKLVITPKVFQQLHLLAQHHLSVHNLAANYLVLPIQKVLNTKLFKQLQQTILPFVTESKLSWQHKL